MLSPRLSRSFPVFLQQPRIGHFWASRLQDRNPAQDFVIPHPFPGVIFLPAIPFAVPKPKPPLPRLKQFLLDQSTSSEPHFVSPPFVWLLKDQKTLPVSGKGQGKLKQIKLNPSRNAWKSCDEIIYQASAGNRPRRYKTRRPRGSRWWC